ncbi:hypothetical protein SAMN05660831_00081 [Thiohalospira halophila DSM 15071]|uniref:Uncharacterized protein n=1 Tax=Thiohalospira halophila DSM 15071 TaxID=1123397 RepID=A0A1I1N2P1_9GAMM|nr:hypothetical protein [Thiohalospira halophila]SFC91934.1 hypothetical protein SAMN05660831_00081 [Thiohalospira halophila DSM 15071]
MEIETSGMTANANSEMYSSLAVGTPFIEWTAEPTQDDLKEVMIKTDIYSEEDKAYYAVRLRDGSIFVPDLERDKVDLSVRRIVCHLVVTGVE